MSAGLTARTDGCPGTRRARVPSALEENVISLFRKILGAAGVAVVTGLLSTPPTQAQEPMRIVIPVPVGAGADNVARVIAL